MIKNLTKILLFFLYSLVLQKQAISQTPQNKEINNKTEIVKPDAEKEKGLDSIISDSFLKKQNITSIMYSDGEIDNINRALESYKNNEVFTISSNDKDILAVNKEGQEKTEDNAKSYVYLNSIVYLGPNNWMVWINGKKISINDNKPTNELYIKNIKNDEALVVWTMGLSKWKIIAGKKSGDKAPLNSNNQAEVSFTIKVGQTYVLRTGKIVEGKIS